MSIKWLHLLHFIMRRMGAAMPSRAAPIIAPRRVGAALGCAHNGTRGDEAGKEGGGHG